MFFNTPARRKFLKAESTELSHVTALVTHYALAHPDKHFELHSATHALLIAPPVKKPAERIYQIFGNDTLQQLIPLAAELRMERTGLPEPPPWKRDEAYQPPEPGLLRASGFVSKPELQKLNRNSIYFFVNRRLVRDRLIVHAVIEAYRNIIPPTSFPVILMFLDMPPEEVDVNVHPAKTEVRFRQPSLIHDFVRDTIRNKLMHARPAAAFLQAITASAHASPSLQPAILSIPGSPDGQITADLKPESDPPVESHESAPFTLAAPEPSPFTSPLPLPFSEEALQGISSLASASAHSCGETTLPDDEPIAGNGPSLDSLASLKPLGQLRESFILAVNDEGLWIIDQHVAHERVLFEKILREREVERVQRQQMLMPMLVELLPAQMIVFAQIADELDRNGFEAEPFGPRTIAIKAAPVGLDGARLERMLTEVLEQTDREMQSENLEAARTRIAASIACHAAIKINTRLDQQRMEWLLAELAKTEHPTSCPHGRPIALRYSWKDIQRAFQRI